MAESLKPEDGNQPPAGVALQVAGCLYVMMLVAALVWLWAGDRMQVLPEHALGRHGMLASAGTGLAAGLLGAWLLTLADRFSSVQSCTDRIANLLGSLGDNQILALSVLSAVAEEVFFRLAVQDALGMPIAVALYVLLNTGPGFWSSSWLALCGGLLFSGLVELGFGLLSATTAHAIINYLSLRRILPT